jgi:hypothetical protein
LIVTSHPEKVQLHGETPPGVIGTVPSKSSSLNVDAMQQSDFATTGHKLINAPIVKSIIEIHLKHKTILPKLGDLIIYCLIRDVKS